MAFHSLNFKKQSTFREQKSRGRIIFSVGKQKRNWEHSFKTKSGSDPSFQTYQANQKGDGGGIPQGQRPSLEWVAGSGAVSVFPERCEEEHSSKGGTVKGPHSFWATFFYIFSPTCSSGVSKWEP